MMINQAIAQVPSLASEQDLADPSAETVLPLDEIKNFAEVFTRIKKFYVEPVSDEELLDHAVRGMLNGLDPHSVYLKGQRFDDLNEDTTGSFGGLGIEVVMDKGYVKVVTPVDETPAARAGIQTGDLIIKINDESLAGLSLRESTNRMRGKPGTSLTMTILRDGEAEPIELELERAVIRQRSVRARNFSEQVGYIRVSQFQLNTAEEFRSKLSELKAKQEFGGLIIDVRNNPGGLLSSAVAIADTLITEGKIVSTKGRLNSNDQDYFASPTDMLQGKPVVVLINAGSASASEIVAAALQDNQRALLLGTATFGKGSVQSVMEINEKEAIKLTTSRYYTPNGVSIQANGIAPDILVAQRYPNSQVAEETRVKERDLPKSLENEKESDTGATKENGFTQLDEESQAILDRDYQLFEAYKLVKGLVLFSGKQVPATTTKVTTRTVDQVSDSANAAM
ncbi:MAG: S41 family peptidase [Pseudomonadota bacterium]